MANEGTKSRKRKTNRVVYFGYDPTISTIPGDPRLNPPPNWFGVNFHKSQPMSNSWQEWAGDKGAMFDISKNKIVPVSKDSEVAKEQSKRRRTKSNHTPVGMPLPFPFFNMMWHPAQPVRNEWNDWENEQRNEYSAAMLRFQKQQQQNLMNGCKLPGGNDQTPAAKEHDAKASMPHPPHAQSTAPSVGAPLAVAPFPKLPASQLKPLVPSEPLSVQPVSSSMEMLLKEREDKKNAASERTRQLAKVNRLRKQKYVNIVEDHLSHLEEIKEILVYFNQRQTRILSNHDVDTPDSVEPNRKQLLISAMAGNSTMVPASHDHCSHKQRISDKPSGGEEYLAILSKPLELRRIKVQFSKPFDVRLKEVKRSVEAIWRTLSHLVDQSITLVAVSLPFDHAERNAMQLDPDPSTTAPVPEFESMSLNTSIQEILVLQKDIKLHLKLSPDQETQIMDIWGAHKPAKVLAELLCIKKVLRVLVKRLVVLYTRTGESVIQKVLDAKQIDKLLLKTLEKVKTWTPWSTK